MCQMAGLQSPEGDLLCVADSWRVANELSNAVATPDSAGWFSVADGTVSSSTRLLRRNVELLHTGYCGASHFISQSICAWYLHAVSSCLYLCLCVCNIVADPGVGGLGRANGDVDMVRETEPICASQQHVDLIYSCVWHLCRPPFIGQLTNRLSGGSDAG